MTTKSLSAKEALAHWDSVHNAREELNGLIDAFPDFNLHEPEGRVSAETVSDLKTAVALLQEVNTRLDVAGDREAPKDERLRHKLPDESGAGNGADKEPDFTVPTVLGRPDQDEWISNAYSAAHRHANHLRKAEKQIMSAKGLAETLRAAMLCSDYECSDVWAPDILATILAHLDKAHSKLDRGERRLINLFLAYFEKDRPEKSRLTAEIMAAIENDSPEELEAFAEIVKIVAKNSAGSEWLQEVMADDANRSKTRAEILEYIRQRQRESETGGAA